MRGRLFLKIYLTVLGGIAILALAGGVLVALLGARAGEEHGWREQRAALLAAALPPGGTPPELQAALERIGPLARATLVLHDASGAAVASYSPEPAARRGRGRTRPGAPVTAPLPGGATLTARFSLPSGGPLRRGVPLLPLALVAGLTALAAWPVVRHLTRRLEHLRRGVETWGAGELSARVPVEGRDEIAAVALSFNRAAAQVQALVAANRALLANASHELRSPLSRLRMAAELYQTAPDEARRAEIERNLDELDQLVGEILLSSRLTHGAPSQPFQPVDLLALAAEEAARAEAESAAGNGAGDGDGSDAMAEDGAGAGAGAGMDAGGSPGGSVGTGTGDSAGDRPDHGPEDRATHGPESGAAAGTRGAGASIQVSGQSVEVAGDARLLSRLVRNLIQNAASHGRPPVAITVERAGGRAGDRAVLSVRDHGPGLTASDLERMFEPFHRPAGHGESAGGWGLGLALVRQIAERHGGTVRAEPPAEGSGVQFVVTLPLRTGAPEGEGTAPGTAAQPGRGGRARTVS